MTQDFAKKRNTTKKPERSRASTSKASSKKAPSRKSAPRKSNSRKKPETTSKKPPLWVWIVVIALLAGFIGFLSKLSQQPKAPKLTQAPPPVAEKPKKSQVEFDFYHILKEHEVDVGDKVIENTPVLENVHYFLQVASFKQQSEADSQRAKLLLLGLPINIESSTNKDGQLWYRVIAGPFTNRSKLAKARSILASERISSFLIKRKIDP